MTVFRVWSTTILLAPLPAISHPAGCGAWWTEAQGRRFAFRCVGCCPSSRPDDRIIIIETIAELTTA
jgi:hypothetical protein